MADIDGVTAGGATYSLLDQRSREQSTEFIYGTQTKTTGTWTGVTQDDELYDGKQILYFLPFAGSGNASLNLTLADGTTTGAKNVYFQSTTRMTTHYGQYSQFRLIYHENHKIGNNYYEGWWSEPGRDTTTTNATQIQMNNNAVKAGTAAIVKANIIVANSDGLYKHLKAGTAFDITWPILYANAAIAAGATNNDVYREINFTVTTTQAITLTPQKPVYIKGSLDGVIFTPVSTTPLTQTIPSSDDGYQYLLLGYGYAATAVRLMVNHPIFEYRNGKFQFVATGDARTVNGHTVNSDVPANADFSDQKVSQVFTTANDKVPVLMSAYVQNVASTDPAVSCRSDDLCFNPTEKHLYTEKITASNGLYGPNGFSATAAGVEMSNAVINHAAINNVLDVDEIETESINGALPIQYVAATITDGGVKAVAKNTDTKLTTVCKITVPETGYYLVFGYCAWSLSSDTVKYMIRCYNNTASDGGPEVRGFMVNGGGAVCMWGISCTAGDILTLLVNHNHTATINTAKARMHAFRLS